MPFCSKCGTEVPENVNFCQKCGNAMESQSTSVNAINNPSLWNPKAAVWWSILFFPLGPFLHYLNWKAMGKDKEAKLAIINAIAIFILYIINLFVPDDISKYINIGFFCAWLTWGWNIFIFKKNIEKRKAKGKPLGTGKEQVEYVAEKYGTEYKRKSWLAPIAIIFVWYGIIIILAIFSDSSDVGSIFGSESEAISTVKKGAFQMCPNYTVEELVNASIEKPKWKHTTGKNGVDYVSISGLIVIGRPTNVMWQLWVKNGTFGSEALEFDEEPENNSAALVLAMCSTARKAAVQQEN